MDANETKFHLLLGREDWAGETGLPPGLAWREAGAEVTLQPRLFRFRVAPNDRAPLETDRRGAGRDRFGNWYWIDESRRKIRVASCGSGEVGDFWPPPLAEPGQARFGEFQPSASRVMAEPLLLSGLAVTADHCLVAGVVEPKGLLIFDLHATGGPRQMLWPEDAAFAPHDIAARPGGGVWVLDRENLCYWGLDRRFSVIGEPGAAAPETAPDFQPFLAVADKKKAPVSPSAFPLLSGSFAPVALEALPDGTVAVLESAGNESRVARYRRAERIGNSLKISDLAQLFEEGERSRCKPLAYDLAFAPATECARTSGRLFVVSAEGNQAFAFDLKLEEAAWQATPAQEFFPLRLFGGKGLVAAGGGVHYDFAERWLPLTRQSRPRYVEQAEVVTRVFDGKEPDCAWHRLMLDGCLPPETSVEIWSRAAEKASDLRAANWQKEPRLYLRGDGPELPFMPAGETKSGAGTWELLLQQARGRYLQLRLRLSGNERATPRLRALRAYYPRFSYAARYLPAVYREDTASASFLERFLANFEGFYTTLEDKIAALQMLFDVRSAPSETLEWLAGWFGVALDPSWDEAKRRLFIKHAATFFQYRGTVHGLRMALRLAFENCADEDIFAPPARKMERPHNIRIVEKFLTRRAPGVVPGDTQELSGPRQGAVAKRWRPAEGRANLHRRYAAFLMAKGLPESEFTLMPPAASASAWREFAREVVGFVPSSPEAARAGLWQGFLARRYHRVKPLNDAHGANWNDFDAVAVFTELPPDGPALLDWYQFESVALTMRRAAHRFTALLPMPKNGAFDQPLQQERLALAQRIINWEKPAHTAFDVKFYWDAFRVGEARLGADTLLDAGGRLPEMVLGQSYSGDAWLPQPTAEGRLLRL